MRVRSPGLTMPVGPVFPFTVTRMMPEAESEVAIQRNTCDCALLLLSFSWKANVCEPPAASADGTFHSRSSIDAATADPGAANSDEESSCTPIFSTSGFGQASASRSSSSVSARFQNAICWMLPRNALP